MTLAGSLTSQVAAQQPAQLQMAGQSVYVNAEGTFVMWLLWSGSQTDDELMLSLALHSRLSNEDDLLSQPAEVLNRTQRVRLIDLPRDDAGHIVAEIPIRSASTAEPDRLFIPEPGVYPVTVEVRNNDGLVSSIRTNLIRLPTETAEADQLPVSLILSVSSADGLTAPDAATLLETHPNVPVTVFLGDGVITQMIDDPELSRRFTEALDGRRVLATPDLDLDLSALAAIDQGQLYAESIDTMNAQLADLGFEASTDLLALETPLTEAGARLLLDMGYSVAIDLGAAPRPGGFLNVDDRRLQLMRLDAGLSPELSTNRRSVQRAHELIARLTVRRESDVNPVLLGGSNLVSLDIMMSALDQVGLIEAIDLSDTKPSGVPVRPNESSTQDLSPLAAEINQALALLDTYSQFHVAGTPTPAAVKMDIVAALSRELNPATRTAALDSVIENINEAMQVVSMPPVESVTLAAQRSPIPLTIVNDSGGPRTVLLTFQSDKLEVAQNNQAIEIPAGTSSFDIEVQARSLGLTPLEIVVLTPDAQHELTRSKLQVRSTAVPGLGMVLSGTALVFLVVWWARSIVRTRRARAE